MTSKKEMLRFRYLTNKVKQSRKSVLVLLIVVLLLWINPYKMYKRKLISDVHKRLRLPNTTGDYKSNYTALILFIYVDTNKPDELREYSLSIPTVACYAALQAIDLVILDNSNLSRAHQQNCNQYKLLLFRKHCVAASFLEKHPEVTWLSVLDGDVGVINPDRDFYEFINRSNADLIFYERFFNWEIASGNYLVKNTDFARSFLRKWAEYESVLPEIEFHSSDNGALQIHLLKTLMPDQTKEIQTCMGLWYVASSWTKYFTYNSCVKVTLGARRLWPRIDLLRRAHAWVIDRDITDDKWCYLNFMFHGWKLAQLLDANWPLKRLPSFDQCNPKVRKPWDYVPGSQVPCHEMHERLVDQERYWQKVFMKTVVYHSEPDIGPCWPNCDKTTN